MKVHGIVCSYLGDGELDIGKTAAWLNIHVNTLFFYDMSYGQAARKYAVDYAKTFPDAKFAYHPATIAGFYDDAALFRQRAFQAALDAWRYDDNDWVVFIDASESLSSTTPHEQLTSDTEWPELLDGLLKEARAATGNVINVPFHVFLQQGVITERPMSADVTLANDLLVQIPLVQSNITAALDTPPAGRRRMTSITAAQTDDPVYTATLLNNEFTGVVPEWEMQFGQIEPTQNNFNWTQCDKIVNWAVAHGLEVDGHSLVWDATGYSGLMPAWITGGTWTRTTLLAALENHITQVVNRYKDRIHTWRVVNEAFEDNGTRTPWIVQTVVGNDWIEKCFQYARAADPTAKLYYNEYNIEWGHDFGSGSGNAKYTAVKTLVTDFKARSIPIDGVGMQCHFDTQYYNYSTHTPTFPHPADFPAVVADFRALGVQVDFTELDIRRDNTTQPATEEERAQTDITNLVLSTMAVSATRGICIWGISDAANWLGPTALAAPWTAAYVQKPYGEALLHNVDNTDVDALQVTLANLVELQEANESVIYWTMDPHYMSDTPRASPRMLKVSYAKTLAKAGWAPLDQFTPWAVKPGTGTPLVPGYLTPTVGTAYVADTAGIFPRDCVLIYTVQGPNSGVDGTVVSQWTTATANRGWAVFTRTTGQKNFNYSTTGADAVTRTLAGAVPAGTPETFAHVIRGTTGQVELFRWSGTAWVSQSNTTGAPFTAFDSTLDLRIGGHAAGGNLFDGRIYSVECRTGSDPAAGTQVWKFDASDYVSGTTMVSNGRTWTLTNASAITKAVPAVPAVPAVNVNVVSYSYARYGEGPPPWTEPTDGGFANRKLIQRVRTVGLPETYATADPVGVAHPTGTQSPAYCFLYSKFDTGQTSGPGSGDGTGFNQYVGLWRQNPRDGVWYVNYHLGPVPLDPITGDPSVDQEEWENQPVSTTGPGAMTGQQ